MIIYRKMKGDSPWYRICITDTHKNILNFETNRDPSFTLPGLYVCMARHLYLTLDLKRFELWHDTELHNMGQIFVICNMEISDCVQSLMWPEMTLTKPSENITISIALSTRQSWVLEQRCGLNSWQLNSAHNHLYESLWLAVAGEVAARDAATMLIPFVISSIGEN